MTDFQVKISTEISSWPHEKIRHYLMFRTAGFKLLAVEFQKKHQLLKLDPIERISKLELAECGCGVYPKIESDLSTISSSLRVNKLLLCNKFSEKGDEYLIVSPNMLNTESLPIHFGPINEEGGMYIKVSPHTRKSTVLSAFDQIKKLHKRASELADGSESSINYIFQKNDKPPNKLILKQVIEIEDAIYDFYLDSDIDYSGGEIEENLTIVESAIKLVTTKKISFNAQKRRYYITLKRYAIPRFAEFLRLIKKLQTS